MTLSPRLAAIARLIPPGSRVCDVGTDHGRLPVWLAERQICPFIIATDLNPGPLESAKQTALQAGLHRGIAFRLANGLGAVAPQEVDTVVIAGMGGETILGILADAPWLRAPGYRLILQPQSKVPELIDALARRGYRVQNQHLVEDAGKLYTIFEAAAGETPPPTGGARYIHHSLLARRDPLLKVYLTQLCTKLSRAIHGLEQAENSAEKRAEFTAALADLAQWRGEFEK